MDVELHHLLGGAIAAVADLGRHDEALARRQLAACDIEAGISDLPVGQAMAEGEAGAIGRGAILRLEGLARPVWRGAAGGLVIVMQRLLPALIGEADRQAAGGADGTEQDVGERMAGLGAQEPGDQDRRRGQHGALQRQRAAILQQHDDRLAGGRHRLRQPLLRPGQHDLGARLRLA